MVICIALLLAASPAREPARQVLKSNRCDACHDRVVSSENPRALAIYDLQDDDWPARMTNAQLPKLLGRLRSASAADRKVVREFIDAELRNRSR